MSVVNRLAQPTGPIRVLQFADIVNRHDFIDTIVQRADPARFNIGVCVRSSECNIAAPLYLERTSRWVLNGAARTSIPWTACRLARLLKRWRADILHVHHYDQAVIGWLATRIYPRTRLVVGRHYSDAIYRSSSGAKQRTLLAIERIVNRAAARIVVPSEYIRDILVNRQSVDPKKVVDIPYGFVSEKYSAPQAHDIGRIREELGLSGRFVLGNFSRLHEEKGQRYLIEAMAMLRSRLAGIVLLIVGEGPERRSLERGIQEKGLGGVVRLLGWRRDAMTIMTAVDAVVQPTLQEAFSQVMAESLWMSKPLVITDVSGAQDIITDGRNGLLVAKADPVGLANAVERLFYDDQLRASLGIAGRAYVEENLAIDRIIPRHEQVYQRLIEA